MLNRFRELFFGSNQPGTEISKKQKIENTTPVTATTTSMTIAALDAGLARDYEPGVPLSMGKESYEGSDPVEESQDNANTDALSRWQDELQREVKELQNKLEAWKKLKEDVIAKDVDLQNYANTHLLDMKAHQSVLNNVKMFFKKIFEKIKEYVEPAKYELHDVLTETHQQVQALCDSLVSLCDQLNDSDKSEKEKNKIKIDVCNVSMQILENQIQLINNVRAELDYCLSSEQISEEAAWKLVQLAVLIAAKIPVPDLPFNLNSVYRNFLYNETTGEKQELDIEETDVGGELKRAMDEVSKFFKQDDQVEYDQNSNLFQLKPAISSPAPQQLQNTIRLTQ